ARWRGRARSAGCPTSPGLASRRGCGAGPPTAAPSWCAITRARHPPPASPIWSGIIARRDPGTTEVEPRYDNGRTVRFSQGTDATEIHSDTMAPWEGTRVLFLQHPSDPIVWWSEDLLFNRPDWLKERRGRG